MGTRKFFILSCLLAIGAIACQWTWLGYCGHSLTLRAQSATRADGDRAETIANADHVLAAGRIYPYLAVTAASAALLFAVVARWRHEGAPTSLPFALLVCYLLTLFIWV